MRFFLIRLSRITEKTRVLLFVAVVLILALTAAIDALAFDLKFYKHTGHWPSVEAMQDHSSRLLILQDGTIMHTKEPIVFDQTFNEPGHE